LSKASHIRKFLEAIFRTGIYESITDQLVEERKRALQQRAQAADDIARAARMLAWVTTRDGVEPEGLEDGDDPETLRERARQLVAEHAAAEESWRKRRDAERRNVESAKADYEDSSEISARIVNRRSLPYLKVI